MYTTDLPFKDQIPGFTSQSIAYNEFDNVKGNVKDKTV